MAVLRPPKKEKIIAGFIYSSNADFTAAVSMLAEKFGAVELDSLEKKFEHTDYYEQEMGPLLKRRFLAFASLVDPSELAAMKLFTNSVEEKFLFPGSDRRRINIDPGLISEPKLVLASTKNFTHRIYIGSSIWAEVTLRYIGDSYTTLEWTYPDYAKKESIEFFNEARRLYRKSI
ncbi:MAG: DUF4416 family protein [Candidatus Goldiibacteriota bacterium]|jgi:hypothetical protein